MQPITLHTTLPQAAKVLGQQDYVRSTALLVLFCSALRLVLASLIELGNDEAYYWLYTQHLQWNYFDHPPLVALWGRLFTANLLLQHYEVFVRLGSIVACALSTYFIFRATAALYSPKAGWYAAVLYNTSLYAGLVSGLLIMPDSPQMIGWTLSLWMLANILSNERSWKAWLLFGLAAGLCIMSKVHGVFLWGGLGLFVLVHKRAWLRLPQLYAALVLTLLVTSPILFWNAAYDFATYRFHSERVVVAGKGINWSTFLAEVLGQLFFNNPVNVALTALASFALFTQMRKRQPGLLLLVYIGLPLIGILLFLSLFRTVYPHWSGPAYVSLIPVAAIYLARLKVTALYPSWLRWSFGAMLVFSVCWPLVWQYYPGTWGSTKDASFGSGDISLDRYGWEEGGKAFGQFYQQQVRSGAIPPRTPLVCNTWWGAHVEYYFCRPQGLTMLGLGSIKDIHHYAWLNNLRKEDADVGQAYCVVPADEWFDVATHYKKYYTNIKLVKAIALQRNGAKAKVFWVFYLSGWKGLLPVVESR